MLCVHERVLAVGNAGKRKHPAYSMNMQTNYQHISDAAGWQVHAVHRPSQAAARRERNVGCSGPCAGRTLHSGPVVDFFN